jgi:hypothetical protein
LGKLFSVQLEENYLKSKRVRTETVKRRIQPDYERLRKKYEEQNSNTNFWSVIIVRSYAM